MDVIPENPLLQPEALEAWLRLLSSTAKGAADAPDLLRSLSAASISAEQLRQWMAQYSPLGTTTTDPAALQEQVEQWWRMMGVVPRSRYLDLLERNDRLQEQLHHAEERIRNLQAALEQQNSSSQALGLWERMFNEGVRAQTDWMKSWAPACTQEPGSKAEPE